MIVNGEKSGVIGFDVQPNKDGSYTIHFSPSQPEGVKESNYVKTLKGKSWSTIFRLYGPKQAWFDQTWRVGGIIKQ